MPSFRLTDREANDMTAYILSLKNKKFENIYNKFSESNKKEFDYGGRGGSISDFKFRLRRAGAPGFLGATFQLRHRTGIPRRWEI